ncbi:MAG: hypothetical protein DCF20_05025 [Pseudanabaena sp.]|nr:MAG: hypothetical protein DCF20_05025 [Pseudanabaena sp.]
MNPFGGIVQKAFYLGLGLATVASEKAGETIGELRTQASKLADELVERGEMTTDEARKFVDDLVRNAQKPIGESQNSANPSGKDTPRTISIDDEGDDDSNQANQTASDVDSLKSKVQSLQDELKRLQKH